MTMARDLRYSFGLFEFAFEETSQPHRYRPRNYRPQLFLPRGLPRAVTFKCYDPPEPLKVHAALARIFHASGLAEHIDKAFRDLGEFSALAKDGSTDIASMLAASSLGVLGSRKSSEHFQG